MDKKYGFAETEKQMQALWKEEELYRFRPDAPGKLYSIDTPPPTVSGSLHMGHVFSYTQAEMIARFRRMQGFNVYYPFGFDDNGLPTERLVEQEHKIRGGQVSRGEFRKICGDTAVKYEESFKVLWQSLGFSSDWSLSYRTASQEVTALSQKLFLQLAKEEKAYCKESPVLWCPECGTSIAQAELDTAERESAFHYLSFLTPLGEIPVATTRPELLGGCVCLFVHPEDSRYQGFIGQEARVPLYGDKIPVYADAGVDPEKGTGAVMCATFGDSTDVQWYEAYKLPYRKVITPDGSIDPQVPFIGGLSVKEGRKQIVALLDEKGLLAKSEAITHAVAVHERCGTEIEIIPSRQWYIAVLPLKERLLQAGDEICWYPPQMKTRYRLWVENLKWDWCISRQRYYGVPFPLWYCKDCGKPRFADFTTLPADPTANAPKATCACGCGEFLAETAVMDTWATSSITPFLNEERGGGFPMGMRTHAHEIIRTWTFYSIVRGLLHRGQVPWKELMISGFVLAKHGEKISKSKSNSSLEPGALIAAHSADAIRYWAAGARLGTDTFFDQEELGIAKRFLTKLWNAARFAIGHLEEYTPEKPGLLLPQDRWILERLQETTNKASALLYDFEAGPARLLIDDLFWKDFCDDYLELVKERLYQPEKHGAEERRSGQYALYTCLLGILKLYAPFVPHITEAVYQAYFRAKEKAPSIHLLLWEQRGETEEALLVFGAQIKSILSGVRRYKAENQMSMKDAVPKLEIACPGEQREWFRQAEMDLLACTHAEKICYETQQ